jgi:hypothetical protein
MSDRELLKDAAKAAGIELVFDPDGLPRDCTGMAPAMNILSAKVWNPIDDDGDALRLAVKLGLKIEHYSYTSQGRDHVSANNARHVNYEKDPYAATRRAIVKAAAEIGRSKT